MTIWRWIAIHQSFDQATLPSVLRLIKLAWPGGESCTWCQFQERGTVSGAVSVLSHVLQGLMWAACRR